MPSPAVWARFVHAKSVAVILTVCSVVLLVPAKTSAAEATEAAVKAAYLYNFGLFVAWPSTVFSAADSPFTICVVGSDPLGGALDATVDGQRIRGHPIAVKRLRSMSRNSGCQIAYFGSNGPAQVPSSSPDVLTVSDDATNQGQVGIINFLIEDDRVRFAIDDAAATQSGLTLSSRLLSLAVAVKPRP